MKLAWLFLLVFCVGCVDIPNNCTDVLTEQQCNNLSALHVPSCEEIFGAVVCTQLNTPMQTPTCDDLFGAEFCENLVKKPTNLCEYFIDTDAEGRVISTTFVCNTPAGGEPTPVVYSCVINTEDQMICQ